MENGVSLIITGRKLIVLLRLHKVPLVTMPKLPLCPGMAYRYMCAWILLEPESPGFIGFIT